MVINLADVLLPAIPSALHELAVVAVTTETCTPRVERVTQLIQLNQV